jgi:hypothetical protein
MSNLVSFIFLSEFLLSATLQLSCWANKIAKPFTMADIDLSAKYTLTNALIGPSKVLASTSKNDSLIIVSLGTGSGDDQLWYFTTTDKTNRYRMHTVQKGDFFAVDISSYRGQNEITVHFVSTEKYTGQYWAFDEWSDGSVRITNDFSGPDIRLGVDAGTTAPNIAGGDHPGQHWTVSRFGSTLTATSSRGPSRTASTLSVATVRQSSTRAPTPCASGSSTCATTAAAASNNGPALSKGAIAGVSVGGFVALVAIISVLIFWLKKPKKKADTFRPDPMTSNPVLNRMG